MILVVVGNGSDGGDSSDGGDGGDVQSCAAVRRRRQ